MIQDTREIVVRIRGLSYAYGDRQAVDSLSLDLRAGETVGLMGPNGSGKSTAFALLTGLLPMATGELEYRGRRLTPDDWQYRCELGVVFQEPSLDRKLTVRENLHLTAKMHGLGRGSSERVERALRFAGLTERRGDIVGELSGGLRRRLDIARAMVHEPRFLLLDEPTTGLDLESFEQTWQLLDELRNSTRTAILVTTHRPDEALRCDRLILMKEGRFVRTATPEELLEGAGNDVLLLETSDPHTVAEVLQNTLNLSVAHDPTNDGILRVEVARAQEWVVPIAGLFEAGTVHGMSVRRPGLSEAYLKVTGSPLVASEGGRA